MAGLVHAVFTVAIILIGFGVMIGRISLSEALKKILLGVVGLFVATALVVNAKGALGSLSTAERAVAILALLLAIPIAFGMTILRSDFGRKVLASILGDWIYDRYQEGEGCCGVQMFFLLLLVAMLALILG